MNLDHANASLFTALAAAQAEVENATKGAVNPHFRSRYADLAEVLNTVRPTFAKHGLSILQSTSCDSQMVHVTTTLAHRDGGYVTGISSCVPAKWDAQGVGAATTYLRRYALAAMAGVAQEDDDGNAASHHRQPMPPPPPPAALSEADEARLIEILDKVELAQSDAELSGLRDAIKSLPQAARKIAVEAGTRRKAALAAAREDAA
ncbi:MAG: hypothetical protein RI988_709 [Pseudomonadota bacterium]|jgi:hypothetical protein